jgi:hypothetical protein
MSHPALSEADELLLLRLAGGRAEVSFQSTRFHRSMSLPAGVSQSAVWNLMNWGLAHWGYGASGILGLTPAGEALVKEILARRQKASEESQEGA